jgi:hypothetical protein
MFDLMPTRGVIFLFLINLKILEQFGLRNTKDAEKFLTEKLTLLQAPVMHLIGMSFTQMPH